MNKQILLIDLFKQISFDDATNIYNNQKKFIELSNKKVNPIKQNFDLSLQSLQIFYLDIQKYLWTPLFQLVDNNVQYYLSYGWFGEDFCDASIILGIEKNSFGDYFLHNEITHININSLHKYPLSQNNFNENEIKNLPQYLKDLLKNSQVVNNHIYQNMLSYQYDYDKHPQKYNYIIKEYFDI